MRQVANGKIYNTATMTVLAERSCYSNGNYCGETRLCKTRSGALAMVHTSNGQDLYRKNWIEPIEPTEVGYHLDGWELTAEEEDNVAAYLEEV